jgi:hypothetical protein
METLTLIKGLCSQFTFDKWNLEKLLGGSLTDFCLHYSYISVDIQRTVEACHYKQGSMRKQTDAANFSVHLKGLENPVANRTVLNDVTYREETQH